MEKATLPGLSASLISTVCARSSHYLQIIREAMSVAHPLAELCLCIIAAATNDRSRVDLAPSVRQLLRTTAHESYGGRPPTRSRIIGCVFAEQGSRGVHSGDARAARYGRVGWLLRERLEGVEFGGCRVKVLTIYLSWWLIEAQLFHRSFIPTLIPTVTTTSRLFHSKWG
jgi:hypothetical protein